MNYTPMCGAEHSFSIAAVPANHGTATTPRRDSFHGDGVLLALAFDGDRHCSADVDDFAAFADHQPSGDPGAPFALVAEGYEKGFR
jgi:hypothetical protein